MGVKINPKIFKAYDIRGTYPIDLNEEVGYRIAYAFGELLKSENPGKRLKIVVSNDMRLSSPSIKENVIRGLVDSGIDVVEIGLNTTPTFYFAVAYGKYDGGIQITASHNPKDDNGFKMVRARAVPVSGEHGIYWIRDRVIENKFEPVGEKGQVSREDGMAVKAVDVQTEELKIDIGKIKPFKIVVDTGNAMAILDIEEIFKNLPCGLIKLNAQLDGSFPVHLADPLKPENLRWVQEAVVREKADLGIVTDGDGDRYFYIDEKGREIRQEIIRGIMAQVAIRENPGAKICYDIRPGRITKDMIEEAGGKAVVTPVGHSLIKEIMIKEDAVFAGESSGHYYYKFSFGSFDAPIVLVLKLLVYLSGQNKPVSEVIRPYQKYHHSGEINSEVEDKEAKIKEIAEKYKDAKNILYLDGVTVEFDDYWFNVRPSNTESLLRLNLEAVSKVIMEKKRDELLEVIRGNV